MRTARFALILLLLSAFCLTVTFCSSADDDDDSGDDDDQDQCPPGWIWDEDLGECVPQECGLDRYPQAPFDSKDLIYVDAAYEGESDGSTDRPYASVEDALSKAGPDTSILIAAGEYRPSDFLEINQDGLDLVGRCSYLTRIIRTRADRYALLINQTESNLVKGISFDEQAPGEQSDKDQPAVRFAMTNATVFTENEVVNSPGKGIFAYSCQNVTISDSRFTANSVAGVLAAYSTGTFSGNRIEDTRPDAYGSWGRGVEINGCDSFVCTENVVANNHSMGFFIYESTVEIEGNEVRENGATGIQLQECVDPVVADNLIERNVDVGIFLGASRGTITGNEVRDTQTDSEDIDGYGIAVCISDQMEVSDNLVVGNSSIGIAIDEASGTVSDNVVQDTKTVAPDTQGYTFGHGIHVQASSDVECTSNTVEGNNHIGIAVLESQGVTVSSNEVTDTLSEGKAQWDFGDGIDVLSSGSCSLSDNLVEDNDRAGILLDFSNGMIEMNDIIGNYYSVVAQNDSMIEINGNTIHGNVIDEIQEYEDRVLVIYDQPF